MSELSQFTQAEREACLPIIETIVELANLTRREGVLALEKYAYEREDDFFKFMLLLICDGTDPRKVEDMGKTLIESGGHSGTALLSRMLQLEGVLMVQTGMNPRIITAMLQCMLGEDFLDNLGFSFGEETGPEADMLSQAELTALLQANNKN